MPAPCRICSLGYAELRKIDVALLAGETISTVMKKFDLTSASSLTRHRLSHLDRSVRRPDRIDSDRSAADMLVGLADSLIDLERIRSDALRHGRTASALKAVTEARTISKMLLEDLALDSTATATWLRDCETVMQGLGRWMRKQPGVATVLATHVEGLDARMARELRATHDRIVSALGARVSRTEL